MLVKVLPLRHLGKRLSAHDSRAQVPFVGWIRLFSEPGLRLDRAGRIAVLQMPDNRCVELYDAQLTQWDGRGLILGGEERLPQPGPGRQFERFRQAWWCRPIDVAQAQPAQLGLLPSLELPFEELGEDVAEDASEPDWIDIF